MTNEQIYPLVKLLKNAVDKMYQEEPSLTKHKGIEQAMVFRIGVCLHETLKETEFAEHNLDCEYNKNLDQAKSTVNYPNGIRPDLLIHKRGKHNDNVLAVEFKGWWNNNEDTDIQKLKDLTHPDYDYRYSLGVFVKLKGENADYRYFRNGAEQHDPIGDENGS